MIKTLYKKFQTWSEKGSVYIISDTHFDDVDMNFRWDLINDYPYPVLNESNEIDIARYISSYLVYCLNKICHKNDTLIILGDIGNIEWVDKLRVGYKVILTGNHDKGKSIYEQYFDEVYDGPLFISRNLVLSHEPLPPGPYFNIHGHEHYDKSEEWLDTLAGIKVSDCYLNACCEHNAFIPMNLGEIIKDKGLGGPAMIHRITIDKATERRRI